MPCRAITQNFDQIDFGKFDREIPKMDENRGNHNFKGGFRIKNETRKRTDPHRNPRSSPHVK